MCPNNLNLTQIWHGLAPTQIRNQDPWIVYRSPSPIDWVWIPSLHLKFQIGKEVWI